MDHRTHNGRNKNSHRNRLKTTAYGNFPSRWNNYQPTPLSEEGRRKQKEYYDLWNYRMYDALRCESEHRWRR